MPKDMQRKPQSSTTYFASKQFSQIAVKNKPVSLYVTHCKPVSLYVPHSRGHLDVSSYLHFDSTHTHTHTFCIQTEDTQRVILHAIHKAITLSVRRSNVVSKIFNKLTPLPLYAQTSWILDPFGFGHKTLCNQLYLSWWLGHAMDFHFIFVSFDMSRGCFEHSD